MMTWDAMVTTVAVYPEGSRFGSDAFLQVKWQILLQFTLDDIYQSKYVSKKLNTV